MFFWLNTIRRELQFPHGQQVHYVLDIACLISDRQQTATPTYTSWSPLCSDAGQSTLELPTSQKEAWLAILFDGFGCEFGARQREPYRAKVIRSQAAEQSKSYP